MKQRIINEEFVNYNLPSREDPNRYHKVISDSLKNADIYSDNLFSCLKDRIQNEILKPIEEGNYEQKEYASHLRNVIKDEFKKNGIDPEDATNRVVILGIVGSVVNGMNKDINESKLDEDVSQNNINSLLKQYKDQDFVNKIVQFDPTDNKIFLKWLAKQYKEDQIHDEDVDNVKEMLTNFERMKRLATWPGSKDINQYRTFAELRTQINSLLGVNLKKNRSQVKQLFPGSEEIYNDGTYQVIASDTVAAVEHYSEGTSWCTKKERGMANNYLKGSIIYCIIKSGFKMYQFDFGPGGFQFADVEDGGHSRNMKGLPDFNEIRKIFPELVDYFTSHRGDKFSIFEACTQLQLSDDFTKKIEQSFIDSLDEEFDKMEKISDILEANPFIKKYGTRAENVAIIKDYYRGIGRFLHGLENGTKLGNYVIYTDPKFQIQNSITVVRDIKSIQENYGKEFDDLDVDGQDEYIEAEQFSKINSLIDQYWNKLSRTVKGGNVVIFLSGISGVDLEFLKKLGNLLKNSNEDYVHTGSGNENIVKTGKYKIESVNQHVVIKKINKLGEEVDFDGLDADDQLNFIHYKGGKDVSRIVSRYFDDLENNNLSKETQELFFEVLDGEFEEMEKVSDLLKSNSFVRKYGVRAENVGIVNSFRDTAVGFNTFLRKCKNGEKIGKYIIYTDIKDRILNYITIVKKEENNIQEMAMDFDPTHKMRPGQGTQTNIEKDKTLYKQHPAFPQGNEKQKYVEILASKNFKNVVEKIKRYYGKQITNAAELMSAIMSISHNIIEFEKGNQDTLKELIIKLVRQEYNIKEDDIIFDLEFISPGDDPADQMAKFPHKKPQIKDFEETAEELAKLDLEVAKRRFINGLIQGSALKGQYAFHLIEQELNNIHPQLSELYGMIMSLTHFQYWQDLQFLMDDDDGPQPNAAGMVEVDFDENKVPIVRARGLDFVVLLQETIKGIMEVLSLHGLPKDTKTRKKVLAKTDFLNAEKWDILFGAGMWEAFLDAVDAEDYEIKNYLYSRIVQMPAEEFNNFMKELLNKTDKGKQKLKQLANQIKSDMKKWDAEDALKMAKKTQKPDDDIDNIDISSLTNLIK